MIVRESLLVNGKKPEILSRYSCTSITCRLNVTRLYKIIGKFKYIKNLLILTINSNNLSILILKTLIKNAIITGLDMIYMNWRVGESLIPL